MGLSELSKEDYSILTGVSCESTLSGDSKRSRINNIIEKAQKDSVTFAFLGGSVTIGYSPAGVYEENYATQFVRLFSEKYGIAGGCSCINAGYSSTNSQLGLAYAETKLRKVQPDVVFVEFAINNGINRTEIISFESLICKLQNFDSSPVVIPVIVCNSDFYTSSSYMELIANHYELPVSNIYHALKYGIERGILEWKDYSDDYAHPSIHGHTLIADCLLKLFEQSESFEEGSCVLPAEACFGREFTSFEFFDHTKLTPLEQGRFEPTDTGIPFPYGWSYRSNKALPDAFCFSAELKSLFVIYEISSRIEFGEAEIYIDDNLVSRIDGYRINGWDNPDIKLVFQEDIAQLHRIEIRMRRGDENKEFHLLGFGIVK